MMVRELIQTCGIVLTVKHLTADRLMYNQERVQHRISYDLDTALDPTKKQKPNYNFTKQTKLSNLI